MTQRLKKDYDALLSSIDFFSQNLHLEQIVEYGFGIFNTFERPLASAIYVLDEHENEYISRYSEGYLVPLPVIQKTDGHDAFAVRNGFLLTDFKTLTRYFDETFLLNAEVSKVMPLITDDKLYGFIISTDGGETEPLSLDFLTRFNYLMNLSLEKASRYLERASLKSEINKRIFNINSISQTMKILLSELDIEKIFRLGLDVIRELTTSSVTSIGIYDEIEKCVRIRAYENFLSNVQCFETFGLIPMRSHVGQVVYKYPEEADKLSEVFLDVHKFENLSAEYVILLAKEDVLGFVTIGSPMAVVVYESTTLERVGDIASILHIAVENASQFELIKVQKEQLQMQLDVLKMMNRIIKTVSSAESLDELSEMIMDTVSMSFGVTSALMMTCDDVGNELKGSVGVREEELDEAFFNRVRLLMDEGFKVHYTEADAELMFGHDYHRYFEGGNCLLLAPIQINQVQKTPVGCLVITRTEKRLLESQVNMVEVLASSVGPILNQLKNVSHYEENYQPAAAFELKRLFERYESERVDYYIEYRVYAKAISSRPFQRPSLEAYSGLDWVYSEGILLIFSSEGVSEVLYDVASCINPSYEEVYDLVTWCLNQS